MLGLGTAVTTTIPSKSSSLSTDYRTGNLIEAVVTALGLSVPSYLLGTAATISVSCRALGGIIGITIFTAVYNNKYSSIVGPLVANNAELDTNYLSQSAAAWKYVWIVVACIVAANGAACCGLESVKPMMNGHIESALEHGKVSNEERENRLNQTTSD